MVTYVVSGVTYIVKDMSMFHLKNKIENFKFNTFMLKCVF